MKGSFLVISNYFDISPKEKNIYTFTPQKCNLIFGGKNKVFGGCLQAIPVIIGEEFFNSKAISVSTLFFNPLLENENAEILFSPVEIRNNKYAEVVITNNDNLISKSYLSFGTRDFPISKQYVKMKEIPDHSSIPWHEPVLSQGNDVLWLMNKKFFADSNNRTFNLMKIGGLNSSDNSMLSIISDWGSCMVSSILKAPGFAYTVDLTTHFCNPDSFSHEVWIQWEYSNLNNGISFVNGNIFSLEGILASTFTSTLKPVFNN